MALLSRWASPGTGREDLTIMLVNASNSPPCAFCSTTPDNTLTARDLQ
ncbi:hypothetical protein ABZX92_39440 [Lentzea sp. NPDC006480]